MKWVISMHQLLSNEWLEVFITVFIKCLVNLICGLLHTILECRAFIILVKRVPVTLLLLVLITLLGSIKWIVIFWHGLHLLRLGRRARWILIIQGQTLDFFILRCSLPWLPLFFHRSSVFYCLLSCSSSFGNSCHLNWLSALLIITCLWEIDIPLKSHSILVNEVLHSLSLALAFLLLGCLHALLDAFTTSLS